MAGRQRRAESIYRCGSLVYYSRILNANAPAPRHPGHTDEPNVLQSKGRRAAAAPPIVLETRPIQRRSSSSNPPSRHSPVRGRLQRRPPGNRAEAMAPQLLQAVRWKAEGLGGQKAAGPPWLAAAGHKVYPRSLRPEMRR
jgi:hypothetical protein